MIRDWTRPDETRQKPTQFSVTYTYVNCPSDATTKCLIFQLNGHGLKQPMLEISLGQLTKSAPGQFSYKTYRTGSTCTVPIDFDLADSGEECSKAAWGYHQKYGKDLIKLIPVGGVVYTANLLAGQTNDVGDVTVTKTSASCLEVTLNAAPGYGVGRLTHIDISCKDPSANLGKKYRTPGQYEFSSRCVTDPYKSGQVCVEFE